MDEIQELKSRLYAYINGWEEIPEGVIGIVQKVFEQIKAVYKKYQCDNASILEGIDLEETGVIKNIKDQIGEKRREQQGKEAMQVIHKMEKNLEEVEKSEKQPSQDREEIFQIGCEVDEIVLQIIEMVESSLTDINARQTRNLSNIYEFNNERIEEIQQKVLEIKKQLKDYTSYEVSELFKKDEEKLRQEVLKLYDEYIEKVEKSEKSAAERFRESMKVGIPLGEQYDFAIESQNKEKELSQESQEPMGLGPII